MVKRPHDASLQESVEALTAQLRGRTPDRRLAHVVEQSRTTSRRQQEALLAPLLRIVRLPMHAGGLEDLHVADPALTLQAFAKMVPDFGEMLDAVVSRHAVDHMFSFVLYYDEVTIGNPLVVCGNRKLWVFYTTLLECNHACEWAWLPLAIIPSKFPKRVSGGFSGLCRQIIEQVFFELGRPDGGNYVQHLFSPTPARGPRQGAAGRGWGCGEPQGHIVSPV